jgi:type I restriction enzyme S subunit
MSWRHAELARLVTDMQPGFACRPADEDAGVPQLRTNNVSADGRLDLTDIKTVPVNDSQLERYSMANGDVLFNNTNSPALVGKTAYFDRSEPYLFSNHMTRIRVDEKLLHAKYLARFLHWTWSTGGFSKSIVQWVSQAAINRTQLASLNVPLPPPSEQRRIVDLLDQADAVRRLRTEVDAKADRILPALFLKMFGDPATNPKAWKQRPIGELGNVETGNTPSRKVPDYYGDNIEWIKSDNINTPSHFLTRAIEGLSESGRRVGRTTPRGSTLVTCIAGSPECIGNAAMAEHEVAFNQQINAVAPHPGIDPFFLYAQFIVGKRLVQAASTGAMKGMVSKGRFSSILFLDPPPDLQMQFGAQCVMLCERVEAQRRAGAKLESLFATLLRRAFSGALTSSWREAHMKELIQETEQQARYLAAPPPPEVRT